MGEIAEATIDGTLCSECGVYLGEWRDGIPSKCEDCAEDGGLDFD